MCPLFLQQVANMYLLKPLQNKKGQKIWGTRQKSSLFPQKRTPNFFGSSYFEATLFNSQQCHIYYSTALILRRQKSGNLDNLLDHTFKRKKELAGHGYLTKEVCNRALTYQVAQAKGQLYSKFPFGVIVQTKIPTKNLTNFCPRI